MKKFKHLKLLIKYIKRYKYRYFIGIFCLLITDTLVLIKPQFLKRAINAIEFRTSINEITLYSFLVFFIILLAVISRYFWRINIIGAAFHIEADLRKDLFRHLVKLSPRFYMSMTTGDIMARQTEDMRHIRMLVGFGLLASIDTIVVAVPSIIIMATINWRLLLIALAPLPFLTIFFKIFGSLIHKFFLEKQEKISILTEKARETFSGIQVIKAFVQEESDTKDFKKKNYEHFKKSLKIVRVDAAFEPVIHLFVYISIIILYLFGGRLIITGELDFGSFVAFLEYLIYLIWPVLAISWVINMLQRGLGSLKRLNKIFFTVPEVRDIENPIVKDNIEGSLEFKDVWFKYQDDDDYILRNINLKINVGETIAFVGKIGSGKTSLINLINRLYDPVKGTVLIDGIDIKSYKLENLRKFIGVVPQETFLFSNSIKENIAFGVDDYSEEDLILVSEISQIKENIMEFPQQFETQLGERGVSLSGGQKQRTAISRAVMIDPQILILDDALSSVDVDTEERILKKLDSVILHKTTLIIAHRISTIKTADRIVVMGEGEIIQVGTHSELIEKCKLYKRIFEQQQLKEFLETTNE
ncbi:ABC transporter ATP-binding protein [Candidatus Dependentiae bacterium]|nr:ABC transporter ATP-binding protein [Candidatus Dependentiae bacterium]